MTELICRKIREKRKNAFHLNFGKISDYAPQGLQINMTGASSMFH